MKHCLPLVFLDGLIIGFINTSMTHFIHKTGDNQQDNIRAGVAFILYGLGSILSGYLSGIFCDKLSLKISSYTNVMNVIWLIAFSMIGTMLNNYYYSCFLFFCWGFSLYYI